MSALLTLQQKKFIYSLERELFSRIAVCLHWGFQQTRELIGLWLWLEEQKFPNIIANMLNLSFTELRYVVEETIVCLNCAWTGKIPPPAYCDIPWTVKLVGEGITLQFFADHMETATEGMKRIMENEYREVFEDIETSLAFVSALLDSQISMKPMINTTYLGSAKSTVPMSSPSSEGSSSNMVFHSRDSQLNHQAQVLVPKSRSNAYTELRHEHVPAANERTRQPQVPVARSMLNVDATPWNEYVPTMSYCANQAQAAIPKSWLSVDARPLPEASERTRPRLGILNGDVRSWDEFVPAASDYANQGQASIPQSWLRVDARPRNNFVPEASERTGQALLSMPTSMLSVNVRPWNEYLPASSIPQSWLRVDAKPWHDIVTEASEGTGQAQVPIPRSMSSFNVTAAASETTSQAQVSSSRSWPWNGYEPESERTMFFTFSRGHPFSEEELRDFLTEMFGDCIESITMQKVTSPYEEPMYAHVILKMAPIVELILDGRKKAKFCFNGKHIWARRWERRDR